MKNLDLDLFVDRCNKILSTQRGTMVSDPEYGFNWEVFKKGLFTQEYLLAFQSETTRAFSFFINNNLCSTMKTSVTKTSHDSLSMTIDFTIDDKEFNIVGTIQFTGGIYHVSRFIKI